MKLLDQNDTAPANKDPWPDVPIAVSSDHTPEQWASHTLAFDPFGFGSPATSPVLTIISDLD